MIGYADPVRIDGEGFVALSMADAPGLGVPGNPPHPLHEIERLRPADPERLVNFIALPDLKTARVVELARAPDTRAEALAAAGRYFASLGKHVECLLDYRPGLVLGRILAQIVNEAHFAVSQGVATEEDCNTAMRLGFNWPRGPFEWGEAIGLERCVAILDELHALLGEERYRVAPLLRARAGSAGGEDLR